MSHSSLLPDAKVSKYDVKQLLCVHAAANAAELIRGCAQLFASQVERRRLSLRGELLKRVDHDGAGCEGRGGRW